MKWEFPVQALGLQSIKGLVTSNQASQISEAQNGAADSMNAEERRLSPTSLHEYK
jgi:hypothetical protein